MKIGNQHIQGIFHYKDNVPFEQNDFVVYKNIIYICTPNGSNEVINIPPDVDTDNNYVPYLGDKMASATEYFNYIDDPSNIPDKYVSSQFISEILSTYLTGPNDKGVITEYVNYSAGSNVLSYSPYFNDILKNANINNVLDLILKSETLNSAWVRVSRDLVPSLPKVIASINPNDLLSVVLRQYTYLETSNSTDLKYRVQEIIDPVNSIVMYRYSELSSENISNWKTSSVNQNFNDQVDTVINHYTKLIDEVNLEKSKLINFAFKFRDCKITPGNSTNLQCSDPNSPGYIEVDELTSIGLLTINVLKPIDEQGQLYQSANLTLNLSTIIIGTISYYKVGELTIEVDLASDTFLTIKAEDATALITSAYYQSFYK